MKTVVFGGSGFLGSHTADRLTQNGHDVLIYDRTESNYLSAGQTMTIGDILDFDRVTEAVRDADYVYHFAGMAGIAEAAEKPVEAIQSNVMGTTYVLEACRLANVKRFVFSSSIYVYSEKGSFYRCSKQACEKIIQNYQSEFGLPFTIMRFGSLYGPRANEFNIIRFYIEQALTQKRILRKGDGEELREYIHVLDAAESCVKVLADDFENEFVIITGHQTMRVKDLLVMIHEIMNGEVELQFGEEEIINHYNITPYSFRPEKALKLVLGAYHDLGTGLLDMFYEIDQRINHAGETFPSGIEKKV